MLQVTKLSNDPASGAAKPTSTAPAKGIAPSASVFHPAAPHPWAAEMLQQVEKEKQQVSSTQPISGTCEHVMLACVD